MKRWIGDRTIQKLRGETQSLNTEWWANGLEVDVDDFIVESKLGMLVQRGRLAPLDERATPLVQYFYSGIVKHQGKPMHRLLIQSKVTDPDGHPELFETSFVFDDTGTNIGILEGPPPSSAPPPA